MWQSSGLDQSVLWHEFPEQVLLAFGAKQNSLISAQHQWWRFVSPMFVHVNLLHLAVNMYSLWIIGPYVEKLYGSAKFVVFWVVTGIAGVVGSYLTVRPNLATTLVGRFLFKPEDVLSAGASGALFGLVGVLFVFGIKYRRELPEGFKRAFGTGMLPVIMINLVIGFLGSRFIDNAAHLGGLIAGCALGAVVHYQRPGQRATVAAFWRVLQVATLVLVGVSFYKVAGQIRSLATRQTNAPSVVKNQVLLNYQQAMTQAQEALAAVIYDQDASMLQVSLQKLQATPAPDVQADELRHRLLDMLVKAGSPVPVPSPGNVGGATVTLKARQDLLNQLTVWTRDYNDWLKSVKLTYPGQ
jgi:rhomboid protease GluP